MRSNNPVSLKALRQFQTVDKLSGFAKAQYNTALKGSKNKSIELQSNILGT